MQLRALLNDTDERLLIEAAQRDPRRFGELYEGNFERVFAFVMRRVRDRDVAEDITAEVFHQALAKLQQFEWRGVPFSAWLMRIAANAIADRWQQTNREQELPPEELEDACIDGEIERRAMLSQLVDELPNDQRTVVVRRFIDQRSIRDIAKELGRSEGAVKQLQFRGLQSLRARIKE
jgi:RNA polymerase sigma-70 factor (ECF subfamily)